MVYRPVIAKKEESPCKKCEDFPCADAHRTQCELRVNYADSFNGKDRMKAVQTDDDIGYHLIF